MSQNLQTQRVTCVTWPAALPLLLSMALFGCAMLVTAHAQTNYQVIKFLDGTDRPALIEGRDRNLYGTLCAGGREGEGVVFKLNKDGSGYTVLHDFTGYFSGEDGSWPQGVVEGSDGALYGTTQLGGHPGSAQYGTGSGTVFKVNKDGSGYAVLHRFSGLSGDGIAPWAGLVQGRDGAFYGTTLEGGTRNAGTIFKLNRDGGGYVVLHSFPGSEADGDRPMAGLLVGSDGVLYGTTDGGGSGHSGTVFKLNPDGSGYTLLHSFADKPSDGRFPRSSLVEGRDGTLYGTTQMGGTNEAGAVFKLKKDGSGYRVLHHLLAGSLVSKPDPQGLMRGVLNGVPTRFSGEGEGTGPTGLVQGSDGAFYGTAEQKGKNGGGTAFKLNPDGSDFTILHNFPGTEGDGQNPCGSMVQGSDGALYGMTSISSTNNSGTVFRLSFSVSRTTLFPSPK
jgi:uncharacterized repeat protein (TIGR03803 family)